MIMKNLFQFGCSWSSEHLWIEEGCEEERRIRNYLWIWDLGEVGGAAVSRTGEAECITLVKSSVVFDMLSLRCPGALSGS